MPVEEKQLPKQARVQNTTDRTLVYKYDGLPIIFRPGEEKDMSVELAGHFLGGHRVGLIDPDDRIAIEAETLRVLNMQPISEEARLKRPDPPLKLIEIVDPNVVIEQQVSAPVNVQQVIEETSAGEQAFASIRKEVPAPVDPDTVLAEATKAKSEAKEKK